MNSIAFSSSLFGRGLPQPYEERIAKGTVRVPPPIDFFQQMVGDEGGAPHYTHRVEKGSL